MTPTHTLLNEAREEITGVIETIQSNYPRSADPVDAQLAEWMVKHLEIARGCVLAAKQTHNAETRL